LIRLLFLFFNISLLTCGVALAPQRDYLFESDLNRASFDPEKFTFVRIMYDSVGGNGEAWYRGDRGWIPRWATDHPDGAKNLVWRLNQLTTIQANEGTLLLRLTDPQLFDYPFIFMSDPGASCFAKLLGARRVSVGGRFLGASGMG
jgi:hypothetical protein